MLARFPDLARSADGVRERADRRRRRDRQPRRDRALGVSATAGGAEEAGRPDVRRVRSALRRRHAICASSRSKSARRCSSARFATTASCCTPSTSSGAGTALFESARSDRTSKASSARSATRRIRSGAVARLGEDQDAAASKSSSSAAGRSRSGSRKGFGALLLGVYDGDALRYVGSVGTGFSHESCCANCTRGSRSSSARRRRSHTTVDANAPAHWVEPELVVEVRFAEWTRDGYLRHRRTSGCAPTKPPASVVVERPEHRPA